jgi:hypothetical protein
MVHLRTVPSTFHARVLAARLGADGIVTLLRGAVDGPYPVGAVAVLVDEEDLDTARELLLADEVEAAFDAPDDALPGRVAHPPVWLALALLFLLAATLMLRMV